jgi:hypothetical protein
MAFWIYGRVRESGQPADPVFCEEDDEAIARSQAESLGIVVERIIRYRRFEKVTVAVDGGPSWAVGRPVVVTVTFYLPLPLMRSTSYRWDTDEWKLYKELTVLEVVRDKEAPLIADCLVSGITSGTIDKLQRHRIKSDSLCLPV